MFRTVVGMTRTVRRRARRPLKLAIEQPPVEMAPLQDRWRASYEAAVNFFNSVKLAIVLILAIAMASIVGTIFPQGDPSVIVNSQMSDFAKRFFLAIDAYNVYYSPWFLTLLALMFTNLAVGTKKRVIPLLRGYLRPMNEMGLEAMQRLPERHEIDGASVAAAAQVLRKHRYTVRETPHGLVAFKGLFGRFAAIITHIGLFNILIAGLCAGFFGFKGQIPIFPGQDIAIHDAAMAAHQRGALMVDHRTWSVRLDKFWIEFFDPKHIKQFYSTLTILDRHQRPILTRTIYVNEPLLYDGVWIYQAFWGVGFVNIKVGNQAMRLEMNDASQFNLTGFLSKQVTIGGKNYFLLDDETTNPSYPIKVISLDTFRPVAQLDAGDTQVINGVPVTYVSPVLYSGLQEKDDPAIPIMFIGFAVLILGAGLAGFSHRQIWLRDEDGKVVLAGKAHKAQFAFSKEMVAMATQMRGR